MFVIRHFTIESVRPFAAVFLLSVALCLLCVTGLSQERLEPGDKDRCPVCGMYVDQYPNWISGITFKSGRRVFFDGPKDLFRYYLNMSKYEKDAAREDVVSIVVTDYYSTEPVNAKEAFFVLGSDVKGPMGKELVPLADRAQAETFLKDHQGEKILAFDEVTAAVLSQLR